MRHNRSGVQGENPFVLTELLRIFPKAAKFSDD